MSTAHDLQRERILAACRIQAVADAASVPLSAWASSSSPRVLPGDADGYIAGLHRGRLPAVEVFQSSDAWDWQANNGGTIDTVWTIRAHVPDLGKWEAESRARLILCTALAAIRSDEYLREGAEAFDEAMRHGPLGHSLSVRVSLAHTYCRSTYETDAVITPGNPVVVIPSVGGYTVRVGINTLSPVLVFTIPPGQALDHIDVHVEEVWDGAGAAVTIGDGITADRFFAAADVELDALATFEQDFDDAPGPIPVVVTIAPGTGANTGRCRVQISTTAAGS